MNIQILVAFVLSFSILANAKTEDLRTFKVGYKYSIPLSTTEKSQCGPLTEADYKKIHDCKKDKASSACPSCAVDSAIRRCLLTPKKGINIFVTQEDCVTSLHDATEGNE